MFHTKLGVGFIYYEYSFKSKVAYVLLSGSDCLINFLRRIDSMHDSRNEQADTIFVACIVLSDAFIQMCG